MRRKKKRSGAFPHALYVTKRLAQFSLTSVFPPSPWLDAVSVPSPCCIWLLVPCAISAIKPAPIVQRAPELY